MITKVQIRNFKKFEKISFELTQSVVLIGPNNAGKSTFLQALMLWQTGMNEIKKSRELKSQKSKRQGISINRNAINSISINEASFLWKSKHTRKGSNNKKGTENIRIEILVDGISKEKKWQSYLEFDYVNSETIYVRPLRKESTGVDLHMIDDLAFENNVSYLQPMSGITSIEDKLTIGSINRLIGQGNTAEILRNICYHLLYPNDSKTKESESRWEKLVTILYSKFGMNLLEPIYYPENGNIFLKYKENKIEYDISSSGRGFQQTLLVLAFSLAYENDILLMDEPDAHLEVIRQREIFEYLKEFCRERNTQIIIASHSEIILNEATEEDKVIALLNNSTFDLDSIKKETIRKFLTEIGWEKLYLAKDRGHIIFFEGYSDLRMIRAFAKKLKYNELYDALGNANIHFTELNKPNEAKRIFFTLRDVIPNLIGFAIFDRIDYPNEINNGLQIFSWKRRELENYFSFPEILCRWAENEGLGGLFGLSDKQVMQEVIKDLTAPLILSNLDDSWWEDEKMSENYLPKIFNEYFKRKSLPNRFNKGNYYQLIEHINPNEISEEVKENLQLINDFLITKI